MCNVCTDVGGKNSYTMFVHMHSLKLVDYLHVQADNPWYNYYLFLDVSLVLVNLTYGVTRENKTNQAETTFTQIDAGAL